MYSRLRHILDQTNESKPSLQTQRTMECKRKEQEIIVLINCETIVHFTQPLQLN